MENSGVKITPLLFFVHQPIRQQPRHSWVFTDINDDAGCVVGRIAFRKLFPETLYDGLGQFIREGHVKQTSDTC